MSAPRFQIWPLGALSRWLDRRIDARLRRAAVGAERASTAVASQPPKVIATSRHGMGAELSFRATDLAFDGRHHILLSPAQTRSLRRALTAALKEEG